MHLKDQKKLTHDKGWKQVLVDTHKGLMDKYKSKAKNIWGGIKATPKVIKRSFKKVDNK